VPPVSVPENGWTADKKALHALNRLAFGPAPGDVERVARGGVASWIRAQMAPASVPDPAVDAKLAGLPTLSMSIAALQTGFPRPRAGLARAGEAGDTIPPEKRPAVMEKELVTAKLVRAVESSRQLNEVLADFWFNHFNVFLGKGEDRWMIGPYERDAIRPHVFGRFRDLLGATATHPAMLWYLDNWSSVREGFGKQGLNENYARELLELHTMGVDGGYTQEDVRAVARCFTGWSIVRPRGNAARAVSREAKLETGTFVYRDFAHDKGEKRVLGEVIPAGGGREDGEKVLDLLARQPATARFLAAKLCRKFVSDAPPTALVARVADTFQKTRGDLRSVYAAIFSSPEFWSDAAFAAKTKTPLELAASAVRALGGTVRPAFASSFSQQIARMGEPLYQCQPPTGYRETAEEWVNAGSLLNRVNFGLALASGRIEGVAIETTRLSPGPEGARAAALLLGSPAFQKQ
jgi:uncharacterized protein (DUF1800 family)